MRILHVITTMDRGGAENHVAALSAAQRESGHEVSIAYLKGTAELVIGDEDAMKLTPKTGSMLRRWVRDGGVVHAHLPRAELAASALAPKATPLVISRHNTEPFLNSGPSSASRALAKWCGAQADTVIAISESVRAYHLNSGHLDQTTRTTVISYGYSMTSASALPFDWPNGLDGDPRPLRIATVARLAPQKDLPTLLTATAQLVGRGIDVDLRIAGDGPDKEALSRMVGQLGLQSNVRLIGRIPNPEQFIAGADVFALPSRYEGLGLVLLEAMAAGTPIVAARNTAIEEVIIDGKTGLLFETGNAEDLATKLVTITQAHDLSDQLVAAARERLQSEFSVDRMLEQTTAVYAAALERKR